MTADPMKSLALLTTEPHVPVAWAMRKTPWPNRVGVAALDACAGDKPSFCCLSHSGKVSSTCYSQPLEPTLHSSEAKQKGTRDVAAEEAFDSDAARNQSHESSAGESHGFYNDSESTGSKLLKLPGCLAAWLHDCLAAWLPGCLVDWLPCCLAAWLGRAGLDMAAG